MFWAKNILYFYKNFNCDANRVACGHLSYNFFCRNKRHRWGTWTYIFSPDHHLLPVGKLSIDRSIIIHLRLCHGLSHNAVCSVTRTRRWSLVRSHGVMAPALGSSSSRTRRGVPSARIYSVVNEHWEVLPLHLYKWELFFDFTKIFCVILQKIHNSPSYKDLGTFFEFEPKIFQWSIKNFISSYKVLGTFLIFHGNFFKKVQKIFIPSLI